MPPPQRPRINVVWFKCTDLRTHDHAALKAAHSGGLPVLHLYVFDPFWHSGRTRQFGFPKTGAIRTRFQLESLADLARRLEAEGHALSTRANVSTAAAFEELCSDFSVSGVFAFGEICSEELRVERQVRDVLRRHGAGPLKVFWGFELYHREDLNFDPARARGPLSSYTAFRKRLEESSWVRPSSQEAPRFVTGPDAAVRWARADARLPTVQEAMGAAYDPAADPGDQKDPRAELLWRGGETAALERVRQYLWEDDCLGLDYVGATMTTDPAKSCMRDKAMSKLSPWLAHGCLSPRLLYEEVKRYERERRKTKSTYWITHELLWRDFVRFGSIQAGTSIFKIGGPANIWPTWQWSTDQGMLRSWVDGVTGFPFVDCFMRELKATGYCNHMGRECAGWFLIGDLGIDWRMGAEWFESVLVDYEPTANWYNWTYRCLPAAGRSSDVRGKLADAPGHRLQGLEILRWGTQHDPDSEYIKRWVPELASLPALLAREPWRLEEHGSGSRGAAGAPSEAELRPLTEGRINVSREALRAVVAMGFGESEAAIALYRAWEDPDVAVALLLAEAGEQGDGGDEEEEVARAIELSLKGGVPENAAADAHGGFRYGVDYPRPIIVPVSIRGTEEAADEARRAQAERDRQIAAAKRRLKGTGKGGGFDKDGWEQARLHRPAETPTAAGKGGRGGGGSSWRRGAMVRGAQPGGEGASAGPAEGDPEDRPARGPPPAAASEQGPLGGGPSTSAPGGQLQPRASPSGSGGRGVERKRRWAAKEPADHGVDDRVRGA